MITLITDYSDHSDSHEMMSRYFLQVGSVARPIPPLLLPPPPPPLNLPLIVLYPLQFTVSHTECLITDWNCKLEVKKVQPGTFTGKKKKEKNPCVVFTQL